MKKNRKEILKEAGLWIALIFFISLLQLCGQIFIMENFSCERPQQTILEE